MVSLIFIFNQYLGIMDLIEKISELRILMNRLESKYPELSELSSLINDIITKCVSLSDVVLNIYSMADSAAHGLIFERNAPSIDLNSALIGKYLSIINNSEDLNDALAKVSSQEKQLLIDAIRVLKKRGAIDLDVNYDEEGLKVKIISRVNDGIP
ncbi:hypothetical protein Vsou_20940 [Vulcanisaeta souniana JCM 11219]|uniref:Uncharacterized protein n=2 Tax=Vulcanisaeta souniana TaxID=164452 RepID=A0A830EJQ2_9CREN|nr:hypothetical protein Vsou_20940 [Vulcanisaeta souniana JCM 11219]GGI83660.1 hypothetical protein GCM10007112_20590 [Vulcanisaeta souniana JCM 11219]